MPDRPTGSCVDCGAVTSHRAKRDGEVVFQCSDCSVREEEAGDA